MSDCMCDRHLRVEKSMPEKEWIACEGHGVGCPCTDMIETVKEGKNL